LDGVIIDMLHRLFTNPTGSHSNLVVSSDCFGATVKRMEKVISSRNLPLKHFIGGGTLMFSNIVHHILEL
jgi:hypothetical protein